MLWEEQGEDEDRSSVFAAEGTVAHFVRDACLTFGFEPGDFRGRDLSADGFTFTFDDDMIEALTPGIEWVRAQPGTVYNEFRVTFDTWLPDQFGTLDVGIVSRDVIVINDLKFGAGIPVSAEENEQLMTYALGFWDNVARHKTKTKNFLLVIDQPRAFGGGGEWEVHLDDLMEFGKRLKVGYAEIASGNPTLVAGEKQCKFCPAKGICPELARFSLAQMALKFDDLDGDELRLQDAREMTPTRRAVVAKNKSLMESWLRAVHGSVLDDAMAGRPTPGLKAVVGRQGPKKWSNEPAAHALLAKYIRPTDLFTLPRLVSPTRVEDLLKKQMWSILEEDVMALVTREPGKPSLADEGNKKAAITVADKFED